MTTDMLSALLLLNPPQADAVHKRFEDFLKSSSTLSFSYKTTAPGGFAATGTFAMAAVPRIRFTQKLGPTEYVFISGRKGVLEMERASKSFREWSPIPVWAGPPNKLSTAPFFMFPEPFVTRSLRRMAPPNAQWKATPDGIETKYEDSSGAVTIRAAVDAAGRLTSFSRSVASGPQQRELLMTITDYKTNVPIPESVFEPEPPVGFVAEGIRTEQLPFSVGEAFPSAGWSQGGRAVTFEGVTGKKRSLVALVAGDCVPSAGLLKFLDENASVLGISGIKRIAVQADGKTVAVSRNWSLLQSARGTGFDMVRASSTPFLFLVAADGTIEKMWQGYHRSMHAALKKEIPAALKGEDQS